MVHKNISNVCARARVCECVSVSRLSSLKLLIYVCTMHSTHVVVICPFVFGSTLLFDFIFFVFLFFMFYSLTQLGFNLFRQNFFIPMSAVWVYECATHISYFLIFIPFPFLIIVTHFFCVWAEHKKYSRTAFC